MPVNRMDITDAFEVLWLMFQRIVFWMQSHSIVIWYKEFTFFDISVGVFATWMLARLIPIFGNPEDDEAIYDDFGGW